MVKRVTSHSSLTHLKWSIRGGLPRDVRLKILPYLILWRADELADRPVNVFS